MMTQRDTVPCFTFPLETKAGSHNYKHFNIADPCIWYRSRIHVHYILYPRQICANLLLRVSEVIKFIITV